jgi:antibiotic biosynthesis monooxygenase (ABM) superfamily enzyme
MAKITRRRLMREGSLAAPAVMLGASMPIEGGAEERSENVFHAFAFRWKPEATEADKERAAKEIAGLQGRIPGLLETHVGANMSPRGNGYTFGGIMRFKDEASLEAYPQNPAHQALLVWLMPLIEAIELDIRA